RLRELVGSSAQLSLDLVEGDLLGEWAKAYKGHNAKLAELNLTAAKSIADLLARGCHDDLLVRSLSSIENAMVQNRHGFADLLEGHMFHYQGVLLERAQKFKAAEIEFTHALHRFQEAGTPFYRLTLVHLAVCEYYRQKYIGSMKYARLSRQGI